MSNSEEVGDSWAVGRLIGRTINPKFGTSVVVVMLCRWEGKCRLSRDYWQAGDQSQVCTCTYLTNANHGLSTYLVNVDQHWPLSSIRIIGLLLP